MCPVVDQAMGKTRSPPISHSAWRGSPLLNAYRTRLDASRDAELFEDAEKIFLDRVLAEVEFPGDPAIARTFGNKSDNLFFARREDRISARVEHPKRGDGRDEIEKVAELVITGPDLPCSDTHDALKEQAEIGVSNGKNSA